jgi:tripartite-type tricarboxylate transporter receptor subunit TctC
MVIHCVSVACIAGSILMMTPARAQPVAQSSAQSFPNRPIRFVTGGGPDAMARILGPKFTETWGQPVVVEERGGAGGMLSAEVVAKANPDGHTLLLATGTHTINPNFYKTSYDMARDFAPVSLLGTIPFVLNVHPSLPVKTADDLIKLAKSRPGVLNYGSGGNGSPGHLIAEMFISRTGVKIVHVPYKTVAGGVTALIADQVQVNFVVGPSAVPQITAGRIRPIAVTTLQRSRVLPDLPTLSESGLAGFDAPAWNGVLVPASTPAPVISKLHDEIVRALKLPDVIERMTSLSFEPVGSSAAEFGVFLKAELVKWARVSKEAGARVE